MRIALAAVLLLSAWSSAAATDRTVEVRMQSSALARAAGNVDESLKFYTPTAVIQMEGVPALRGRAEVAAMYRVLFPTLVMFWNEIHEVRVAESGDLAYEIGTNFLTTRDDELLTMGIKQSTTKYLAVWIRSKDGQWRIDALSITRNP